ncbi:hypothetical protein ACEQ8H_007758 [Pleosporales sp. CAS-2024a]
MATTPIHLEGTTLEGGGQLLRIALALSSLTRTPINITNIRGRRSGGGGLKAQHLAIRLTGGTNVSNSPSFEYMTEVLIPMLALIGIPAMEAKLHSRGWSQGSTRLGSATYTMTPLTTRLPAFQLADRGHIKHVKAIVIAPRDTEQHFRDQLDAMLEKGESGFFGSNTAAGEVDVTFQDSQHEKRYYMLLVATSTNGIKLGRDWLYDQGVRPGKTDKIVPAMVMKVSEDLLREIAHGGCVDEYMRDELVVFQALAEGKSRVYSGRLGDSVVPPSLHAKTATWVAKKMMGVDFDEEERKSL